MSVSDDEFDSQGQISGESAEANSSMSQTPGAKYVAGLSGQRVLLVDDSSAVRQSAYDLLSSCGCTVVLASDGVEALSSIMEKRPDMVFVDTIMPRLDGYQVCALIKGNTDLQSIPVILIGDDSGFPDEDRAQLAVSDATVSKPLTAHDLRVTVAHIALSRQNAAPRTDIDA